MNANPPSRAIEVTAIDGANAGDRRVFTRYPLALTGELVVGGARRPCQILDFSGTGMSVRPLDANGVVQGEQEQAELIAQANGNIVEMIFGLPGSKARVRARAFVRRITRQGDAPKLGVAFASANPDVFEALVEASDRGRLTEVSRFVPQRDNTQSARSAPWEALARYVSEVLDTCFHRCQERLQLRAQYGQQNAASSQWYFALIALKAAEQPIKIALTRELLESAYAAGLDESANQTQDGLEADSTARAQVGESLRRKLRSEVLEGLDDRAILTLLAQRNKPLTQWLAAHREAPFAPAALFRTFKQACGTTALQDDARDMLHRTFREAVSLNWPFTKRILEDWLRSEKQES